MFNERGIEYVGLRELAAILEMRVSNITYYFATKDDLVYALSLELREANNAVIVSVENLTMSSFFQMLHEVFNNHVRFRCLLLSVVHLMTQNKHMAVAYNNTQQVRNATMYLNLQALDRAGYLKSKEEAEMQFLVSGISLISRFWISEAAISFADVSIQKQIHHYLSLLSKLLMPYATANAKKEMDTFLKSVQ